MTWQSNMTITPINYVYPGKHKGINILQKSILFSVGNKK
jgi:hypothetical protein